MINLNFNGIDNTLVSSNFLNISFNINKNKIKKNKIINVELPEIVKPSLFQDSKTTLGGWGIDLIDKINDNIIVYLFIQKNKQHSAWNLVAPVILEKETGKINQYGLGCFALEGSGGGLGNTSSMFNYLTKHKEKGFQVSILPKVIDNLLLTNFEYADSGIKLNNLLDNSIDLISYRKESFIWIYKQYQELMIKYKLE